MTTSILFLCLDHCFDYFMEKKTARFKPSPLSLDFLKVESDP